MSLWVGLRNRLASWLPTLQSKIAANPADVESAQSAIPIQNGTPSVLLQIAMELPQQISSENLLSRLRNLRDTPFINADIVQLLARLPGLDEELARYDEAALANYQHQAWDRAVMDFYACGHARLINMSPHKVNGLPIKIERECPACRPHTPQGVA